MAERRKKSPDADGGDNTSSKRTRTTRGSTAGLWSYALFAIGVSLAGIVVGTALIWWQVVFDNNVAHREALAQSRADAYAAFFNGRLATLRREIDAVGDAPSTRDALGTFDPDVIRGANEALAGNLPYARRIDIIPKGTAEVDLNSDVPINFAALDVIRRAETQAFVGPEVSLQDRGVSYVARPIALDGRVGGVLFAAIANDYFLDPLQRFAATDGMLLLDQKFEGLTSTTVLEFGSGGRDSDDGVTRSLDAAHWTLVFKPSATIGANLSGVVDLAAPLAVAIGLLLGGIALAFSRLFRKLEADGDMLTDYIMRIGRGRGGRLDRYQLELFQKIAIAAGSMPRTMRPAALSGATAAKLDLELPQAALEATADDETDDTDFEALDGDLAKAGDRSDFLEVGPPKMDVAEEHAPVETDPAIFRAYDVRGVVGKSLTAEVAYWIARAFAAESLAQRQRRVVVGGDGRHSSDELRENVVRGLQEGGCNVIDIGCVPTPLLYYATHALNTGTGIMVTGSHNPPEYNGLKMVIGGMTLSEEAIQALRDRIEHNDLPGGSGEVETIDLSDHYVERIVDDVAVAQPLKVVVDCGNGAAGLIAPRLLAEMGCEVVPLYAEVDGDFPNHHPDPADPANLEDLITVVAAENADIGLAFDGDGDRLGVITNAGTIIWPDRLMMLFARDIVGRNPGADVIYDVKCSRHLNSTISELGGRPIMWKTGHSHIKRKIKETGALLGGEFSGHICFAERWFGFDDAIYSAARLLEIIGTDGRTVEEIFADFPTPVTTPEIKVPTSDEAKFDIVDRLGREANFGSGTITDIDGLRVDFVDGWGLIRASNTSPVLTLRFEADSAEALKRIQQMFRDQLSLVDGSLEF